MAASQQRPTSAYSSSSPAAVSAHRAPTDDIERADATSIAHSQSPPLPAAAEEHHPATTATAGPITAAPVATAAAATDTPMEEKTMFSRGSTPESGRLRALSQGSKEEAPKECEAPISGPEYPDGGFEAWMLVFGAWVCSLLSWGYINSFGVLEEYYLRTFLQGYNADTVAWISSLQYFWIFAVGLFTGRLFDMGLFKPMMTFGMVLWLFSQMMLSLCTEFWQLILAQGFGVGISCGIVFSLSVSVPAQWFLKRRALAFGIVATGSSIGGVIFPILCQQLLPKIGFGWTMRIIGFIGLALFIPAWLFLKTRLPPSINPRRDGWRNVKWVSLEAFRMPAYSLFVLGSLLILFGLYTPFTYVNVFTAQYNIPIGDYMLAIFNAASVFGRVIPGALADRFGKMNVLVVHLWICAVAVFLFPLCKSLGPMLAFSIVFGFASGCYVSLIPANIGALGPVESYGTRLGQLFAVIAIGGLLGTPVSGALLGDHQNSSDWWKTMGFAAAMITGGAASISVARQFALRSLNFKGII